eukprot:3205111-Alexandrium_andersonii.AAC.1
MRPPAAGAGLAEALTAPRQRAGAAAGCAQRRRLAGCSARQSGCSRTGRGPSKAESADSVARSSG